MTQISLKRPLGAYFSIDSFIRQRVAPEEEGFPRAVTPELPPFEVNLQQNKKGS